MLVELQRRLEDGYVERLARMGPPPESIAEFFRQVYDLAEESRREHPALMREILAMYVRTDVGTVLTDQSLILHVVDYLGDAAERGAVRRDIVPEQLAVHFLSAMFVHFMGAADADRADEFADTKIDILVRGMAP